MAASNTPPPSPDNHASTSPQDEGPTRKKGFSLYSPIWTNSSGVSWSAIFLMSFLWFGFLFQIFVNTTAIAYTIKHYTQDPRIISLTTSLGGLIGMFIGPVVSFLSDRVWTRFGRRKPFVLVAWSSTALGTALVPLVPVIGPWFSEITTALGLGPIKDFYVLASIIVSMGVLSSFGGPLEPLCLEVVPPAQRGRFWAMRNMLNNLASLYFFQLLFPVFDMDCQIWPFPFLGQGSASLTLRGEQMIYILSSGMFFITSIFMIVNIRERKMEQAANMKFREIKIGPFIVSFFKEVFGDKRWYPLYLIMVVPGVTGMVWGSLMNIMMTDQFGYSKPNLALLGLPAMVISIIFVTPFAGWYSDRKPKIGPAAQAVLALVSVSSLALCWYVAHDVHTDKLELPAVWMCFFLCSLISVSVISAFIVLTEFILRFANRDDMRVWISALAILKDFSFTLGMYLLIKFGTVDGIPPITLWMLAGQFGATSGALVGVIVGPMIFEFIPKNKLGTVASGSSILNGFMTFAFANVGASWIVFYTNNIGSKPANIPYDYTGAYLLQLVLFPIALGVKGFFLYLVVKGRMKPYGRLGLEE